MLIWHKRLWLIDHGAALYFHHTWSNWSNHLERSRDAFKMIKDHVLLPFAATVLEADAKITERLTPAIIETIVTHIPDAWLTEETSFSGADQHRQAYIEYLLKRLEARQVFVEEAIRARAASV